MPLLANQIESILREALNSKIGIIVKFDFSGDRTQSLYQVTRMIYRVQKALELPPVHIRASPDNPDNEMWIFKTTKVSLSQEETGPPPSAKTLEIGDIF